MQVFRNGVREGRVKARKASRGICGHALQEMFEFLKLGNVHIGSHAQPLPKLKLPSIELLSNIATGIVHYAL